MQQKCTITLNSTTVNTLQEKFRYLFKHLYWILTEEMRT